MSPAKELLAIARDAWPLSTPLACHMPTTLAVVLGDFARLVRDGGDPDATNSAASRELGNLILNALRYADDLGLDVDDCIASAAAAQRAYRERRGL